MAIAGIIGFALIGGVAILTFTKTRSTPDYQYIFVIIEENHSFKDIIGNPAAPNLTQLAQRYGLATKSFAQAHPSEPNYVALLGGSTFNITDDDAFFCYAGNMDKNCSHSKLKGYPDHTIVGRSLVDQLTENGLTWKGYFESIPAPASQDPFSSETVNEPAQLYASKHNGFMSFIAVQKDPRLGTKIVGFNDLKADLVSGNMPNYAHIVPNECNDMHGLEGEKVPKDCFYSNDAGLIARGDSMAGQLVGLIQSSPLWSKPEKAAIVITWDEDNGNNHDDPATHDCCGFDRNDPATAGGGRIPTIVITNHGPRGIVDDTPYNHYSLLRRWRTHLGYPST